MYNKAFRDGYFLRKCEKNFKSNLFLESKGLCCLTMSFKTKWLWLTLIHTSKEWSYYILSHQQMIRIYWQLFLRHTNYNSCSPTNMTWLKCSALEIQRIFNEYHVSGAPARAKRAWDRAPYSWNMVNLFSFGCHVIDRAYVRTYVRTRLQIVRVG